MNEFFHRTHIVAAADPAARVILTETRTDGSRINMKVEVTALENDRYRLSIDYVEKAPRHKRGRSSSTPFVISRAGLDHIFGTGT